MRKCQGQQSGNTWLLTVCSDGCCNWDSVWPPWTLTFLVLFLLIPGGGEAFLLGEEQHIELWKWKAKKGHVHRTSSRPKDVSCTLPFCGVPYAPAEVKTIQSDDYGVRTFLTGEKLRSDINKGFQKTKYKTQPLINSFWLHVSCC